jgi:hypothetical protein
MGGAEAVWGPLILHPVSVVRLFGTGICGGIIDISAHAASHCRNAF